MPESDAARPRRRLRTLIVGAGGRVRETILPALACLPTRFEIVGVYTRSLESAERIGEIWGLKASNDLALFRSEQIDLVIVAVTTQNVPEVITRLDNFDLREATIMLDTPVLASLKDLGTLRRLRRCKQALVSEDCIALPQIAIVKELLAEGRIGRLRKIWFFHSGFKYHAIATMRTLVAGRFVLSARATRYADDCSEFSFRFANSVTATVVEPRDYATGRMLVAGSKGMIADYPVEHHGAIRISYLLDDGKLSGFAVDGAVRERSDLDVQFFENVPYERFNSRNLMSMLKIRGLMELLAALHDGREEHQYSVGEGLYDRILSVAISRLTFWLDPLAPLDRSLIDVVFLRLLAPMLALVDRARRGG